jgi:ribonuclease HI/uncharacterized protein with GYD domain
MKVEIYTDGGSRGNPGPAGCGVVIRRGKKKVLELARYLGRATNNVAEYEGIILGLERAAAMGATEVVLCSDSELLVRQISGAYKVKARHLKPLYNQVMDLLKGFANHDVRHVYREANREADALANEAMDSKQDIERGPGAGGPCNPPAPSAALFAEPSEQSSAAPTAQTAPAPGRSNSMVTAIVLCSIRRDRINSVSQQLADTEGVAEVYSVAGDWDVVAIIRASNNEQLADIVTGHMLKLEGVVKTNTLIAFKAASRYDLERMFGVGME